MSFLSKNEGSVSDRLRRSSTHRNKKGPVSQLKKHNSLVDSPRSDRLTVTKSSGDALKTKVIENSLVKYLDMPQKELISKLTELQEEQDEIELEL